MAPTPTLFVGEIRVEVALVGASATQSTQHLTRFSSVRAGRGLPRVALWRNGFRPAGLAVRFEALIWAPPPLFIEAIRSHWGGRSQGQLWDPGMCFRCTSTETSLCAGLARVPTRVYRAATLRADRVPAACVPGYVIPADAPASFNKTYNDAPRGARRLSLVSLPTSAATEGERVTRPVGAARARS